MDNSVIRVLIVDDEILIREGIRRVLDTLLGVRVVAACTGGEAAGEALRWQPDLVLLDLRRPYHVGQKVLLDLLMLEYPPVVAVLTAVAAEDHLSAALRGGATGFLLKDISPQQLEYAIRELANGHAVIDPRVTRAVIQGYVEREAELGARAGSGNARSAQFAPAELLVRAGSAANAGRARQEELTAREREVLGLLAEGLSNNEIGKELHIGTTTVKDHVSVLLGKLRVTNRVQAAVRAHQRGLVAVGRRDSD